METLSTAMLQQLFRQAGCTSIILIAGAPCQPFSSLGRQQGFNDPRSHPLQRFFNIRDELRDFCQGHSIPFFWLLEEVATMTEDSRHQITKLAGVPPILLQAADFGWVHRARLYWGPKPDELQSRNRDTFINVILAGQLEPDIHIVRWLGPAVPSQWQPLDDFRVLHKGGFKAPQCPGVGSHFRYPEGRFLTFTTVFPHPADRAGAADDEARLRFQQDGRRYPLAHYVSHNVLWRDGSFRTLSAREREVLMGLPFDYTAGLTEDRRCSAIGNGFHVPSVIIVLLLLLGIPHALAVATIASLPSVCDHNLPFLLAPHAMSSDELLDGMLSLFDVDTFTMHDIDAARTSLEHVDLRPFFWFHQFASLMARPQEVHGPDLTSLTSKASLHLGAHNQYRAHGSSRAFAPILPGGLDKDQHIAAAQQVRHPFATPPALELDVHFVIRVMTHFGLSITSWRRHQESTLRALWRACAPLRKHAQRLRPKTHKWGMCPVMFAAAVVLFRWHDCGLPRCLLHGFDLAGQIQNTGVFRVIEPRATLDREDLLGQSAIDFVDELERDHRVHPCADKILEETLNEVALGLAGPARSRQQLDNTFGRGKWRPIPRHIIEQGTKWRPVDDGKRSRINEAAHTGETIVCQTGEFVALATRSLHLALVDSQDHLPEGVSFTAGVEDCWKGYRQNFASMADRRFCVVTFVHPHTKRRVYHQLFGLPFGLGVVVNQFCRAPSLFTAIARRFMALLSAHYFDDNCLVDYLLTASDAKSMFHRLAEMFGIVFSPSKALRMQGVQNFLGSQTDLTRIRTDHCILLDCKPSTKQKGIALIDSALASNTLSPASASKLRGVVQWVDNWLLGRPCRGALSALVARQYYENLPGHILSARLVDALTYLKLTMEVASGRVIQLRGEDPNPVIIYTDASAEDWTLRIGILIFVPGCTPIAASIDVPHAVIAQWSHRSQYIGQAELLAAPL
eukprot:6491465-Amphidinium_carterae.1